VARSNWHSAGRASAVVSTVYRASCPGTGSCMKQTSLGIDIAFTRAVTRLRFFGMRCSDTPRRLGALAVRCYLLLGLSALCFAAQAAGSQVRREPPLRPWQTRHPFDLRRQLPAQATRG